MLPAWVNAAAATATATATVEFLGRWIRKVLQVLRRRRRRRRAQMRMGFVSLQSAFSTWSSAGITGSGDGGHIEGSERERASEGVE